MTLLARADASGDTLRGAPAPGRAVLALAGSPASLVQVLIAGGAWQIERVSVGRLDLKRAIAALVAARPAVALVVIGAPVELGADGPALVVGDEPERYPDEATLPLGWVREQLAGLAGATIVCVASPRLPTPACVDAVLGLGDGATRLAVVAAPIDLAISHLVAGLGGAALDPTTGTVTVASLGAYLATAVPDAVLAAGTAAATIVTPAPVALSVETMRARRVADRAAVAPIGAGTVLPGRFRLDVELARGSFGAVWRARQLAVDRDVAIKLLHDDVDPATPEGRMFLQEVRAVGRLDHPHVVRIYQADVSHDGRLFFAMELLDGPTLAALIADGPIALDRARGLTRQLLAGLAAAHDAGLVHADIKPANAIVVESRGHDRLVLVDFGLARLRHGEPQESLGGTPAFMAPEQLRDGRVDARSDVFAAALVMVAMLTGWRRTRASDLVPPLDAIADAHLRQVLVRALAIDPAARFASAQEFAAALDRSATAPPALPRPPFHRLASLTERDRDRLFGRDRELALLVDHALVRAAVIVTAPSGVGKTSLLRAGLGPRLEELGARAIYASARAQPRAAIVAGLETVTAGSRVVVVIDQVEALLEGDGAALAEVVAAAAAAPGAVGLVFAVREDFLARLLAGRAAPAVGSPVVRIGPIDRDSARLALTAPLAEQRIELAPALIERILDDLTAATAAMAPDLGWGATAAVYPPHLQLLGAALYAALEADQAVLTLAHYERLGGFAAIVSDHLERVLESEFTAEQAAIARELFLALVTSTNARATRDEDELVAVAGERDQVRPVLDGLRDHGLLVRVERSLGAASWELVHDSLVPRVQRWLDRHDLARRQAMEQVRYHVRRSRRGALSLLSRRELRELAQHRGALDDLETEHARGGGGGLGPREIVGQSRRHARISLAAAAGLVAVVAGGLGWTLVDRRATAAAAARERSIRDRDLGRFTLTLAPFDWTAPLDDPRAPGGRATPVEPSLVPGLTWAIHDPDPGDAGRPGPRRPADRAFATRTGPASFAVEASGGPAFLVVTGRGRSGEPACGASILPLRALPGYAQRRHASPVFTVPVPTCQATYAGTIEIPAGPFVAGGPGDPPSQLQLEVAETAQEQVVDLPAFAIDRTEITNAAYQMFASVPTLTGVEAPIYVDAVPLARAREPSYPVAGVGWHDVRRYCAFLGKRLPSSDEWQKAARGGARLPDGRANPHPRRNLPWGAPRAPVPANINDVGRVGPVAVGEFRDDVSPYGVRDLAGNLQEWTASKDARGLPVLRGGNWDETASSELVEFMAVAHSRQAGLLAYSIGARCAAAPLPGQRVGDQRP